MLRQYKNSYHNNSCSRLALKQCLRVRRNFLSNRLELKYEGRMEEF